MSKNLIIRKLADRSDEGARSEDGSWPLAGVSITDPPDRCAVSQDFILKARSEGWARLEGLSTVYRPSAPSDDPTQSPPHVFVHADSVVFLAQEGEIRYRVVHQPDKYADADGADDQTRVTPEIYDQGATRVDYHYELELEN